MATLGGIKDVPDSNSLDIEALARFAVEDHNKKQNALLEFVRLVHAKQQTVAGTMYYLTVEVKDGGVKKHYKAKIWEKVWLNFKEVQEFELVSDDASQSSA